MLTNVYGPTDDNFKLTLQELRDVRNYNRGL
jgi:hypothetical protein